MKNLRVVGNVRKFVNAVAEKEDGNGGAVFVAARGGDNVTVVVAFFADGGTPQNVVRIIIKMSDKRISGAARIQDDMQPRSVVAGVPTLRVKNLARGEGGEVKGTPRGEGDVFRDRETVGGGESGAETRETAGTARDRDARDFINGDLRFAEQILDEGEESAFLSASAWFGAREDAVAGGEGGLAEASRGFNGEDGRLCH